jgi:hypothetical protein
MTSISTPPITPHQPTSRLRSEIAAEVPVPIEPMRPTKSQAAPSVVTSASLPGQDAFLSKVFDILHKMQGPDAGSAAPVLDGEDLEAMVGRIDADGDGRVTSAEFVAARPEHVSEEDAARLFASLDTQGEGVLALNRLTSVLGETDPGVEPSPLASLDPERDMGVDREQFLASMQDTGTPDDAVATLLRLLGGRDEDAPKG